MSFTITKYPDEPIIYADYPADFDLRNEILASIEEFQKLIDTVDEPVFYIVNTLAAKWDFGGLADGSNLLARGDDSVFHHPNIKEIIFLTTDKTWKMLAEGLRSDMYGNLTTHVFEDLDEALDYVRSKK